MHLVRTPPPLLTPPHNHIVLIPSIFGDCYILSCDCYCTCRAKLALFEATEKVKSELDLLSDPLELNFSGLGNFSKSVLFAKVAEGPSRERLIAMAG